MSIGISYDDFWHMNPHIINIIAQGHNKRLQMIDAMVWQWFGTYGLSAVSTAIEHNLAGSKAKSKYIEKPILHDMEEQKKQATKELTEEEKKRQTEQLFMRLKIMGANFNINHQQKKSEESE